MVSLYKVLVDIRVGKYVATGNGSYRCTIVEKQTRSETIVLTILFESNAYTCSYCLLCLIDVMDGFSFDLFDLI